jgi:hypothetical protein
MTAMAADNPELLVTRGGHLYRVLRRAGFETPAPAATTKAAVLLALVTWLPLLLLSLAEAPRIGGVSISFLRDFSTAIRFLVTLPVLVLADSFVEPRLAAVARQFIAADLVPEEEQPRFLAAISRALWLRDALLPQIVILVIALGLSLGGLTSAVSTGASNWHVAVTAAGPQRTWAGTVYDFFSLPLYRFVILTWLWRYVIWTWFLWRTSQLRLRIVPSHPDVSGGLGFIGVGHAALSFLIVALSISAASVIGMRVAYSGASLPSFYPLLGGYLAIMLIVFLGPLFMFSPVLWNAKRRGLYRYSTLGGEYTTAFEQKWMESRTEDGEQLLGSADIQSLADLANSFDVVQRMRLYPFGPSVVAILSASVVLPLLPLALMQFPVSEILRQLAHLLL